MGEQAAARLYLGPPKQNGDDDEPTSTTLAGSVAVQGELSGKDALDVIWRDGVFRVADPHSMTMADRCELRAKEVAAENGFLEALDKLTEQRRHTSHSPNATNFAPKVMVDAHLVGSLTRKELAAGHEPAVRRRHHQRGAEALAGQRPALGDRHWAGHLRGRFPRHETGAGGRRSACGGVPLLRSRDTPARNPAKRCGKVTVPQTWDLPADLPAPCTLRPAPR